MENKRRSGKTVLTVVVAVLLLVVSNAATFLLTKYYPVFKGDAVVVETKNEKRSENVSKLLYIMDQLDENFLWDIDEDSMWDHIFKGMMEGTGDKYSEYMNEEEYAQYQDTVSGSYSGIGVEIANNTEGNVVVMSVFKDSPAYEAGLKTGDVICSADDEDLLGTTTSYAVTFIRGEIGTSVHLGVLRDGEKLYLDIVRGNIERVYVNSKMLDGDIGYINITEFETNTYDQFASAVKELTSSGMNGLILDLRQNPGGLVNEAVQIADDLLPKCQIVYLMDKKGNKSSYNSDNYCLDVPLVVLVDEYSASSSEILTVALKDNDAATIVGKTTFGKGIVQIMIPLSDGSFYKYTYQQYYGPAGDSIHGKGITPDVEAELPEEYQNVLISDIPYENDTQLQKAVEVMEEKIGR